MHIVQLSYSLYITVLMFRFDYSIILIIVCLAPSCRLPPQAYILFLIYTSIILVALCVLMYNQTIVMMSGTTTYGYLMNQKKIHVHRQTISPESKEKAQQLLRAQMQRELYGDTNALHV